MRTFVFALVLATVLMAGCGGKKDFSCNDLIETKARSACMYNMSMDARNPAFCKDIPDAQVRAKCIDDISVKFGQDVYCFNHERLPLREECERKVADANRARKANATNQQP